MKDQVNSLMKNNIWILIKQSDMLKNHQILTEKWVYTWKHKSVKFKAHWVIKNFWQRYEVDYFEIYTAVAKLMSYKIILTLTAHYSLIIHQMNIKSVFLNAELNEEIYMKCLEEFKNSEKNDMICRLLKFLYRFKQSSQIWAKMLKIFLKNFDLVRLKSDHCIFINCNISIIVAVYVNDLLLVESTTESLQNLKNKLESWFKMTNINLAENYLDIEIS